MAKYNVFICRLQREDDKFELMRMPERLFAQQTPPNRRYDEFLELLRQKIFKSALEIYFLEELEAGSIEEAKKYAEKIRDELALLGEWGSSAIIVVPTFKSFNLLASRGEDYG